MKTHTRSLLLLLALICNHVSAQQKPQKQRFPPDIASRYDQIFDLEKGFAAVQKGKKYGLIDSTGKEVVPLIYEILRWRPDVPGYLVGSPDSGVGLIDLRGNILVAPAYHEIHSFQNNLAVVRTNPRDYFGKYGFINRRGKAVIPLTYDLVHDFEEGMAIFMDKQWGAIDTTGKIVIPPIYTMLYGYREGMFWAYMDGKHGFLDHAGKVVVPFVYDMAGLYHEGLAKVRKGRLWGLVDKKGVERIPVIYDMVGDKSEGLISVDLKGKFGFVNDKNQTVIPFVYDDASAFENGIARVRKDGDSFRIDKKGRRQEDEFKQAAP
jgi:hypothetical protein